MQLDLAPDWVHQLLVNEAFLVGKIAVGACGELVRSVRLVDFSDILISVCDGSRLSSGFVLCLWFGDLVLPF